MELVSTVQAGDRWITHCTWAPWKASDAETGKWNIVMQMCSNTRPPAVSTLACGLSNGNVTLIDVTQKLFLAPPGSPPSLKIVTVIRDETAAVQDKRIITAMKWVSRKDDTVSGLVLRILV